MAEPIPLRRVPPPPAPPPREDALRAAGALLQDLHDRGAIDLLRGLVGAGGDIATRLSEGANTPEAIAAMRNVVSLARILGSIDPETLHRLADLVAKAPRYIGIAKRVAALGAAAYGLHVFSRVLRSRRL